MRWLFYHDPKACNFVENFYFFKLTKEYYFFRSNDIFSTFENADRSDGPPIAIAYFPKYDVFSDHKYY